jgi:hypothetical protein
MKNDLEIALFCHPGEAYRGLPVEEVAKRYTAMASDGFDKMLAWEPEYAGKFLMTPDYVRSMGRKGDRKVTLSIFAQQPVIGVKGDAVRITSSSNLLNPECEFKKSDGGELYLPDLERS